MNKIDENILNLLNAIKDSEEYRKCQKEENNLLQNRELWDRVEKFRANNFRLQNDSSEGDLFEKAEKLAQESAELRKIPEVNAYLDAELAMCKMLQKICKTLVDGVEIRVPDF